MSEEEKYTGPSKKHSGFLAFDRVVATILLLVFALVIVTGVFTYLRLNRIVNNVSSAIRPDEKLILVKEIFNKLSDAENSVKSYSLTKKENYLSGFYEIVQETEEDFSLLWELTPGGDTMMPYIDTLDILVEKKFSILEDLLVIQDEYRVQQALNKVVESIRESRRADSLLQDGPADKKDQNMGEQDEELESDQEKERPGFFARLFSRKNKEKETESEQDSIKEAAVPPPPEEEPLEKINQQIEEVRTAEMKRESALRAREWALIQQDKLVMDEIREVLSELEELERNSYDIRTKEAEHNARDIKVIIAIFCIAASLLLIVAAFAITRYVRSNNSYRKALKKASDEARDLAAARQRFLANMSHEIRTPMNVIKGFTGQLTHTKLTPEQEEYVSMVKKSADHLLHILNDILDYSKLEAERMKLTETVVDLQRLIIDTERQFKPLAKEKDTLLKAVYSDQLPRIVLGDEVRLRQILYNLVGNAVKFTDYGEVEVIASLLKEEGQETWIRFEVSDTGIGISDEDLKNIFIEFEQAGENPNGISPGTGLGLSITKKLVELHGGKIDIRSKQGKGTVVMVDLPFNKQTGEFNNEDNRKDTTGKLQRGLKILVADDEEFNRKLLATVLRRHGCVIQQATGGKEALEMIMAQQFDLLLTDNRMPDMDGKELCRKIRALDDKEKSSLPVVVITAVVSTEDQEEYRAAGMDGFVPKPFEEKTLINIIMEVTDHHETKEREGEAGRRAMADSDLYGDRPEARYDLEEMRRLSGNDMAFFYEMVDLFLRNTESGFKIMRMAISEGNMKLIAEQAHKISAPCKHIRAEKLYQLLKEIEKRGFGSGDPDHIRDLVGEAEAEFQMISDDIKKKKKS